MAEKACLIALAFVCFLATGTTALKCTHCAYINDGQCEKETCDGLLCSIRVHIDSRVGSTLVHKSCESVNVAPGSAQSCVNSTEGAIQTIVCNCNSDFCTDSVGSDIDFVNQLLLTQSAVSLESTLSDLGNGTAAGTRNTGGVAGAIPPENTTEARGSTPAQPTSAQSAETGSTAAEETATPTVSGTPEATTAEGTATPPTPEIVWSASEPNTTAPGALNLSIAVAPWVKCTHCAYVDDGECEKKTCEGEQCSVQVHVDARINSTLVHKSCESVNVGAGQNCLNHTEGDVLIVVCSCNTDFCTDSIGSDIDFINQLLLTQSAIPIESKLPDLGNGTATGAQNTEAAVGVPPANTAPEGTAPPASSAETGTPPTPEIVWSATEPNVTASGTEAGSPPGAPEVTATPAGPEGPANATEAVGTTPASEGPGANETALSAPAGAGPGNETENTPPPAEFFFNVTAPTGGPTEATPTGETTGPEVITAAAGEGPNGTTAGEPQPVIKGPPASQITTPNANISAGLGDLENVVNERVMFFSAVSLQRLPTYLAENLALTPDKQHYDVLTSRLDGDMSFNQQQLEDIVESERIYLPPRPVHDTESGGPDPFNGVLIGRDLEQVNAWPQLQPILYAFRPTVDNATRDVIRQALALWQNNTCVSFSEGTSPDQFVLDFDMQPPPPDVIACGASTVGRWPEVKLTVWKAGPTEQGCATVGTIAHELGHILGLWHAQSRFDAYEFVYVPADTNGNVDVHPQSASQSNFDVGYDYGSIMHFAEDAVRPKDPRFVQTTGQRREPSFIDYKTINLQQRCLDLCPAINCFVGGYATPPDCAKCHCPTGFGGDHCETVRPSVGDCGPTVGSKFATDDWTEITVTFPGGKGPEQESKCFWHIWGRNGSQVELQVLNVSMRLSPKGCVDDRTGERNFIEIKVGDNDADKSFDFQRTGFRLCSMDPIRDATERPMVSTNRLIVLAAYAGSAGSFTIQYRNAGGGNPGLAAAIHAAGLANPVRPGIRVSASANSTAQLLFEAGEEAQVGRGRGADAQNQEDRCDVRRSLVPGDRLASPCRVLRSLYGRYTYVFTRRGRHRIYFNEQYFEPRILIYDARLTPPLKNAALINDKSSGIRIEDENGTKYDPFPYFLGGDRQHALGPIKLVVTEDGRLVARSENGTEVTLVCLAHFSCVRLHRRIQSMHETSNDTRVMLQGGILYSDNRLYFVTLNTRGELALWERAKATDALSTAASKSLWVVGTNSKGRTGQPYRLYMERDGTPSIRNGDDEITWKVNATIAKDQLPTTLSLTDQGKLILQDARGKEVWTNQ